MNLPAGLVARSAYTLWVTELPLNGHGLRRQAAPEGTPQGGPIGTSWPVGIELAGGGSFAPLAFGVETGPELELPST